MDCCKSPQCQGIEEVFDDALAQDELKDYRERGPSKQTRTLLDAIRAAKLGEFSLMDVGGGVGAIQHDLAEAGALRITNVDASPAYSQAARQEAERCGYAERAAYRVGDFVQLSTELEPADVVTLDRVICCYNDMPALVGAASRRARKIIGVVYPRDAWYVKLGMGLINFTQRVMRHPFRVFVHPSAAVDALIRESGFHPQFHQKGFVWQVVVYGK